MNNKRKMKKEKKKKLDCAAGCQWLTPVIPATQELEIRKVAVQSQPWVNSSQDPISKKPNASGVAQGVGPEFKPQYCKKRKKKTH
jgi:hypothetical protein